MEKFYLAKSNKANPDDVMRVRQLLSKYDINVVEYTGGAYSHKPLKECNYLVIVPDMNNVKTESFGSYVKLGKGLHDQIIYFTSQNNICSGRNNILVVKDTSDGDLTFSFFEDLDLYLHENDYIDYSSAILKDEEFQLVSFMDNLFDFKISSINSKGSNYYYLIGK